MGATEAAQAHFEYMALGAEIPYAYVPIQQLEGWVQATEGARLPAHQMINTGWLRQETALTIVARRRAGHEIDTSLEPQLLLDGAQECFDEVSSRPANDPVFRSRAILAAGALGIYRPAIAMMADERVTGINYAAYDNKQIEAAELLMKTAQRRGMRNLPLHDLHIQGLLLVLNSEVEDTDVVGLPVPTRLQEEGDERRADLLLWDTSPIRPGMYLAQVTTADSAPSAGHIVFPAQLLHNDRYPSEIGQGTLQAILEQHHKRKMQRHHERERHHQVVSRAVIERYIAHVFTGSEALSFQADQVNGLDDARRWYAGLSPLRRMTAHDAPALQQGIVYFNQAHQAGESSLDDDMTLAWLQLELGNATQGAGEQTRAATVFKEVSERAVREGNWVRHFQALGGRAAALLYEGLSAGGRDQGKLVAQYQSNLKRVITQIFANLPMIEGGLSDEGPQLRQLLDRLLACYAVSSSEEYLAVFTSPRQQGSEDTVGASDVIVLPYAGDTYNLHANGRLRLSAATQQGSLDRGVATFDPARLRNTWRNAGDDFYEPDTEALNRVRDEAIAAVDPVLFM